LEHLNPVVVALVKLLQALRVDQGLSLEDLADRANVHRTTVGLLERGERSPSLSLAGQLASALGYPLSDLLAKAELVADGKLDEQLAFAEEKARQLSPELLRNTQAFENFTGMRSSALLAAMEGCYHTLDMIDDQLTTRGSPPIAGLVELANLSSMVGNLVGGTLAEASEGLYIRNRPHHYPDLLSQGGGNAGLELKVALEKNRPKGHLPKPGHYITFRYVLGDRVGGYSRGKENRGNTVWFWEARVGDIGDEDFDISNTPGDSGKTAVVKSEVFKNMHLVFFDPKFCPHPMRNGTYPGYN
jgi:transcriptional regulator with XRE-family HTH domain